MLKVITIAVRTLTRMGPANTLRLLWEVLKPADMIKITLICSLSSKAKPYVRMQRGAHHT